MKVREKELAQHPLGPASICTLLNGPKGVVGLAFFVRAVTLLIENIPFWDNCQSPWLH